MSEPNFWDDNEKAQTTLKRQKVIDVKIQGIKNLQDKYDDLEVLIEMYEEEPEQSIEDEIGLSHKELHSLADKMKLETLLTGDYDYCSAILSIHAGTGGLDAQDWAEMILRMYTRWSDKRNFNVKILDIIYDTEAGIKSATILIEGINAYGFLKSEKGVHRLVRISPYNSAGKRQTSFASVDVMPELDDSVSVEINPADLNIDTYRASGAGGQHVNTTDSAVRITHIPTGVVVQCQNERSQITNRNTAMKMLMAKLIELAENEQKDKIDDLKGDYSQIAWGSQIRSYVFHPYSLAKDHRTNAESGNIQAVMDGDINLFIDEYLKNRVRK